MLVMGSLVAFAPSSGAAGAHAPVHMPDVVGKTRAETFAIMAADQLFFTTHGSGSNDGSWVRVIAQYPAAGTLVPFRSTVSLTVTVGVVHEPLPAPNLIGKSRAQVYSIRKAYQLYFTTSGPGASNGTWKSVVGQTPFADTLIKWHSFMHLTVSRAVPHPKVAVPHVVGDTRAEAIAAFNAAEISFNAQGPGGRQQHLEQGARRLARARDAGGLARRRDLEGHHHHHHHDTTTSPPRRRRPRPVKHRPQPR